MRRSSSKGWMVAGIVVALLFVIGLVDGLTGPGWAQVALPIIILGGIFLLYKFPPSFMRGGGSSGYAGRQRNAYAPPRKTAAQPRVKKDRTRSRTVPFRVIEGGKDDDDTPKYH